MASATMASATLAYDGVYDDGICEYSIRWHLRRWHLISSASDQTQSKQTIKWNVLLQIFIWTITKFVWFNKKTQKTLKKVTYFVCGKPCILLLHWGYALYFDREQKGLIMKGSCHQDTTKSTNCYSTVHSAIIQKQTKHYFSLSIWKY